jgi:hypothetical protein
VTPHHLSDVAVEHGAPLPTGRHPSLRVLLVADTAQLFEAVGFGSSLDTGLPAHDGPMASDE